jgi:hypothetical protein
MSIVNYGEPVFWTPANANGRSASINVTKDDATTIINFYWSGMHLATRSESSKVEQLEKEINDFLKSYAPTIKGDAILHFQHDSNTFHEVVNPKWVPGL